MFQNQPLRDHLEAIQRQSGKEMEELNMSYPEGWDYILDWFYQLHSARAAGSNGPAAITYTDIINWKTLLKLNPTIFEIHILKRLDNIFLEAVSKEQQAQLNKLR